MRVHDRYANWGDRDARHRADCRAYNIFPNFANHDFNLPPWRLSKQAVNVMDRRVRAMWWPHYIDRLTRDRVSFWKKSDRMWKAKHKLFALLVILPTCLHGYVKAIHMAILLTVDALRRLFGMKLCAEECRRRGIEIGERAVFKAKVRAIGAQLVMGLTLIEGSFPVGHLNPILHHLVHYGAQTKEDGSLDWTSLFGFERNNKRMKNLVRSNVHPESSLTNMLQIDISSRAVTYEERLPSMQPAPPVVLISRGRGEGRFYIVPKRQKLALGLLGVTCFAGARSFGAARIQGTHFKSGEWGRRLCGSVFTTFYGGRSRYGYIKNFLLVQSREFAVVNWLSKPVYPYAPITLVVRVHMLADADQLSHMCVVSCDDIEPCSVCVLPDEDGVHYYMMRTDGTDRR